LEIQVCYETSYTVQHMPSKGTSYLPLPGKLRKKKGIISLQNEDDECFNWCITRAMYPKEKDQGRIDKTLRQKPKEFNWEIGCNFSYGSILCHF